MILALGQCSLKSLGSIWQMPPPLKQEVLLCKHFLSSLSLKCLEKIFSTHFEAAY